jgi:hypothetical protein
MALYRHGLYIIGARLDDVDDDVEAAPLEVFAVERFAGAEPVRGHSFAMPRDPAACASARGRRARYVLSVFEKLEQRMNQQEREELVAFATVGSACRSRSRT